MSDMNNNESTSLLVREILQEKRRDRRWRNIRFVFWFALFAYIIISIARFLGGPSMISAPISGKKYVSFVRLNGTIAPDGQFSAESVVPTLHDAFEDKNAEGVVIDINSPGGTPVQASIIHDAIIAYKKKYNKRVVIVGEDLLTSGAYFIAVAADKIYVNPNTLTGSIGVIMKGFGFVEAMKKVGIERRVYIQGDSKDRLDPFLPQTPEDVAKVKSVMAEVHQNFEVAVLEGRKGKLKADPATIFNGDFWSGQSAVKLGLVDGLGNLMDVMEKEFSTTRFVEYGGSSNIFKSLSGQFNSAFDSMMYTG